MNEHHRRKARKKVQRQLNQLSKEDQQLRFAYKRFPTILGPLIEKIWSGLSLKDIIDVQPMYDYPSGEVYHMNIVYKPIDEVDLSPLFQAKATKYPEMVACDVPTPDHTNQPDKMDMEGMVGGFNCKYKDIKYGN